MKSHMHWIKQVSMNDFTKTFRFFFQNYPTNTMLVIALLVVAGFAEAVGVAAFLPFLQVFFEEDPQALSQSFMGELFTQLGLPINFISLSIFIVCAISCKALLHWVAMYRVGHIVAQISDSFRIRLIQSLLKANWGFFTNQPLGKNLNAIVHETFTSSTTFLLTTKFFSYTIQFLIYFVSALILSWKTTLMIIGVGIFVGLALWILVHISRKAGLRQTKAAQSMLVNMGDMLQGIKPLKAMALENNFFNLLNSFSYELRDTQKQVVIANQARTIFYEPLMIVTALIGLYVAMEYGGMGGSELTLMGILFFRLLGGLNSAQAEYQRLVTRESALWSLMDSIKKAETAEDKHMGDAAPPRHVDKIQFQSVSFAHGSASILNDVDLNFRRGQMTALIGASGSGKTTILDLISGFFVQNKGEVLINDRALKTIDRQAWRQKIGFVPQDVFMFNSSIYDNITMGREKFTEEDVWRVLDAVDARAFAQEKDEGLHAPVGENGRLLSGGQKQRLAIARAIIHDPQILLLDEATSALDQETEQRILKTLRKLSKTMTVIFASHNQDVLKYADKVYALENGMISEAGV